MVDVFAYLEQKTLPLLSVLIYFFWFQRMNIFVGSLPFSMQEGELNELFQEYGEVSAARIIKDRATGRSKGYGFVEMPNDEDGQRAIDELNGAEVGGRTIVVNVAKERERSGYRRDDRRQHNNY